MRYKQPQYGPAQIDWANPITKGLAFAFIGTGSTPRDSAQIAKNVVPFNWGVRATTQGLGAYSNGSSKAVVFDCGITGANYSLLTVGATGGVTSTLSAIDDDRPPQTPRAFQFRLESGVNPQLITFDTTNTPYFVTGPSFSAAQATAGVVFIAAVAGNALSMRANGVLTTSNASNPQRLSSGTFWLGDNGSNPGAQVWASGGMALNAGWTRTLTPAELASLESNPWQIFASPRRILKATTATGTTITPGKGAIALSGKQPSIASSANQSIAPTKGSLLLSGKQASVAQSASGTVQPAKGTLLLTGYASAVARTANQSIAPTKGSLLLAGKQASIVQTASATVQPGKGSLLLTSYAPTLARTANQAITPTKGSLLLSGKQASVTQTVSGTVQPGKGTLLLSGYAATIARTANQSIAPTKGTLLLTGYVSAIARSANQSIAPTKGMLVLSGKQAAVMQSASVTVQPAKGTLLLTSYAATVARTANQSIAPTKGSLLLTGKQASVTQVQASPNLTPGSRLLSISGYTPVVLQSIPVTKIGGDDVPYRDDERIEVWESYNPKIKNDDSLKKILREAYVKASNGKISAPIAEVIAKPTKVIHAPVQNLSQMDEDDVETLLLSF